MAGTVAAEARVTKSRLVIPLLIMLDGAFYHVMYQCRARGIVSGYTDIDAAKERPVSIYDYAVVSTRIVP
jgi:hypothetical protein